MICAHTTTKICSNCHAEKQLSDFRYQHNYCKRCESVKHTEYFRTKNGCVSRIYAGQRERSRKSGYDYPEFILDDLREWAFKQPIFHKLFDVWVESGYEKMLSPSFDRTDDYQGYSLDRLKIMTWGENKAKGESDRKSGINNKINKAVRQKDLNGALIAEHYSMHNAGRVTGVSFKDISSCCRGVQKTAGGFLWEYA